MITASSGGQAPVTTSGGLGVTILGGAAAGSTAISIYTTANTLLPATTSAGMLVNVGNLSAPVTTSYGTLVQISTGPATLIVQTSGTTTVVSASSGLVQVLTSGPLQADLRGQVYSSVPQHATINLATSGNQSLVSAVSSMSIYVLGYAFIVDSSNTLTWVSSSVGMSGAMIMSTIGSGMVCPVVAPTQAAWMKTSVAGNLGMILDKAAGVRGHLTYYTASS